MSSKGFARIRPNLLCGSLLLLLGFQPIAQASDAHFVTGKSALAIPFELDDNLIYVQVTINGSSPLSFILDTGAFTIVDFQRARGLGVKLKQIGEGTGVGDENPPVFLGGEKVSFSLPGVTLSKQRLLAVPLDKVEACANKFVVDEYGRGIFLSDPQTFGPRRKLDGILGAELFHNCVVEIDYPARLINIYQRGSYKYNGKGLRLPLEVNEQHVFVQAQIPTRGANTLPARLLVDTGSAMAITLNKRFTDEHGLLPPREKLTPQPICGLSGMAKEESLLGDIDAVLLGSLKINNPVLEYRRFERDEGADGFIGGAVFRRYKVIFDYSRREMILEQ